MGSDVLGLLEAPFAAIAEGCVSVIESKVAAIVVWDVGGIIDANPATSSGMGESGKEFTETPNWQHASYSQ